MNILAVDTAGESLSVALRAGEKVYAHHKTLPRPHDETMLKAAARLLAKAGLKAYDLDAVAAASGPGRFTGIRVGMAYAAVLAGQLKKPALALSRFHAVAAGRPEPKLAAVVVGWREERFYQLFRKGRVSGSPVWVAAADWPAVRAALESGGETVAEDPPTAAGLLPEAARLLKARRRPPFEPLYLKPASYERNKRK